MVNTWESTLTEKAMIYLDLEDRGILKQETLIEESISIAASLAQKMIGRGMEVGICVNRKDDAGADQIVLSPAGGKKQLTVIEQMLAKHKATGKMLPFGDFLNELTEMVKSEEDAVMIFISKNAAENAAAIAEYVGTERHAILVVPYPKNEDCNIICGENIRLVKREVERT